MISTFSFRSIHRRLAILFSIPIIVTIVSGFAYRFARNVLSVEKVDVEWLMKVHVMSILGLQSIYPLIIGLMVCFLTFAGLPMTPLRNGFSGMFQSIKQSINQSINQSNSRVSSPKLNQPINQSISISSIHRWTGLIVALPLLISSITGIVYTLEKYWLNQTIDQLTNQSINQSNKQSKWLMSYHQGSIYGSAAVYCSIIFLVSLPVLTSGCLMLPYMRRFRSNNQSNNQIKYSTLDGKIDGSIKSLLEIDTDSDEDGI